VSSHAQRGAERADGRRNLELHRPSVGAAHAPREAARRIAYPARVPSLFRAPGLSLRIEELLERVRPSRAARELVRSERLRFARTYGVGEPWQPGAPVRDLRGEAPPGAAFWLDDTVSAAPPHAGDVFELELPGLPWTSGVVPVRGGSRFTFEVFEAHGDRVRAHFVCKGEGASRVLAWCAQAGAAAVGDLAHGGSLALSGEPLFAPGGDLRVSEAAARALSRGHPWLTRDKESEDEGRFAFGAVLALRDPEGRAIGAARIEGGPQLVARVWAAGTSGERRGSKPASVEERIVRALARREKLIASGETDALRLVHGEADALPGLFADRFGPLLRILVASRAALPLWERSAAALAHALRSAWGAEPSVVLALQLKPQPPGELLCVRQIAGPEPPEPLVVREGELAFRIDSGLTEATRAHPGVGFFPDQRRNRQRLSQRVRSGGAYLNLFAHTGAFSAVLLAAGAGSVTSVDLSAAYLARLQENLERSGLPTERHRAVRREVRRFLAELAADAQFDGIVLDPPTAASAGREFWSARAGLEALASECLRRLSPRGFLLVSSNDRRARGRLRAHLEAAARAAGVSVALSAASASPDFPALRAFPEGDPFEALFAERLA
jgi:23S rRNA (cytosine1962-C5)-methyltransferase